MGVLAAVAGPLADRAAQTPLPLLLATVLGGTLLLSVLINVLMQVLFKNPNEPPVVFHWFPFVGSTVSYGIDPIKFFFNCREKYGEIFTFVLLGSKTTVFLGTKGNDFILNGRHKDLCAEDIYSPLTTPVFGKDVVYDCPNEKLMEQKKFMKYGLTTEAFATYVHLIADEVKSYVKRTPVFKSQRGIIDVVTTVAEITIFTAARSLQGKEVRSKFDASFADLYHWLDMGFSPINFMLPYFPLPHNRRRDYAHKKMVATYTDIIRKRRADGNKEGSKDMIWNLMQCKYKTGRDIPDHEIAHMMIALLMAGQHSSSSTTSWIILHLASDPSLQEELLEEQKSVLGPDLRELTYDDLAKLPLHAQTVKETLRLHSPIHSIMRKVRQPMPVDGTSFVIPPKRVLLAAPTVTSLMPAHFPEPSEWKPHRWDDGSGGTNISAAQLEEETFDYGYGLVSKGAKSPYLPFGAGRHRCIGEQFAYVQLQTILAYLVRELKFENKEGHTGVPNTDYSSLFSRPACPAFVQFELRKKDE